MSPSIFPFMYTKNCIFRLSFLFISSGGPDALHLFTVFYVDGTSGADSIGHGGTCRPTFTNGWARGGHRE